MSCWWRKRVWYYIENFQKMAGIFSCAGEIVTGTLYVGGGSKGVFGDLYGLLVYIFQLSGCCGQLQVWQRDLELEVLISPAYL